MTPAAQTPQRARSSSDAAFRSNPAASGSQRSVTLATYSLEARWNELIRTTRRTDGIMAADHPQTHTDTSGPRRHRHGAHDHTDADADALELLRRIFDEGFSTGDGAVFDEVCSPDIVVHQFGLAGTGAEAIAHLKAAVADVHRVVPDMRFTIEDHAASGDVHWVRVRGRGTATGPFFGPPSGRPIDITVIDVARVRNGLIVEHWGVPDRFAMLAQTGVLDRL